MVLASDSELVADCLEGFFGGVQYAGLVGLQALVQNEVPGDRGVRVGRVAAADDAYAALAGEGDVALDEDAGVDAFAQELAEAAGVVDGEVGRAERGAERGGLVDVQDGGLGVPAGALDGRRRSLPRSVRAARRCA